MKFEMRKLILLHIILLFSVVAMAQTSSVASGLPYECGFEEGEDLSAWTLNYGTPNATDQWMFGSGAHSEGKRSLYVSSDGVNPSYGRNRNITVAYLRYKFPQTAQNEIQKYDVSFDWTGTGDSVTSRLYVMYGMESEFFPTGTSTGAKVMNNIINAPNSMLSPNKQVPACQSLGDYDEKFICGSEVWQNVSFTKEVSVIGANSDKVFMFVFIWENTNTQDTTYKSSIIIDNFQINTAAVKKPINVAVYPQCEDSSLLVTWDGQNATTFDIEYRKVGDMSWTNTFEDRSAENEGFTREGSNCSYIIKPVLEGTYNLRIRGKNDGLVTSYTYVSNIFVYCPDNHCVNYVNLYDTTKVLCTYGYYFGHQNQNPYSNVGIINFGPDRMESRHTIHVDPTELDPRTDSLLHTVPPGALASVRLGNWNDDFEAEAITYTIDVDTASQGILIVKYAVVLEDPGHSEEPEFRLEILDSLNNLIDPDCGFAKFAYSDAQGAGWTKTNNSYGTIAWKDWTTVGVNLMAYHNQKIRVRFTTMDCNGGAHFGYAYFTVDCANAHIETQNCGNESQVTCIAPDGFNYLWYRNDDINDVVDSTQTLIVDPSRTKYTCRVSFVEQPGCFFEISTTSEPRFPVPDYTAEPLYGNCMNKLRFNNTSHVMNKFDGNEHHTSERCSAARWKFRSLVTGESTETTAMSPEYTCREEGDTIEVTLTSYIGADNSCDSVRVDTIVVPNILSEPTEFRYKTCYNDPVEFDGKYFNKDTVYVAKYKNIAGCDSTSTLYLKVIPQPKDVIIHDSICSDQSVTIAGVTYNRPMDNELIMFKTVEGCDSALYLTLTVNERINAKVDTLSFICADDEQLFLTFDIAKGVYDSIGVVFNTPALRDTMIYTPGLSEIVIPYPDTITPAVYQAEITFYQFCCGPYTQVRDIEIRYRSSIVEQKWNDVLTLLSPKYNGGFEFMAFQWYKDDMPIEGETHSYLYQPLDVNSIYYVELTRPDGTKMTTCPIQPVYHEQQTPYPTIVQVGQHMPIYMEQAATIWYYTISGQLYSTFTLPQGYASLPTPGQAGVYIIRSVSANGESQAQVMIAE